MYPLNIELKWEFYLLGLFYVYSSLKKFSLSQISVEKDLTFIRHISFPLYRVDRSQDFIRSIDLECPPEAPLVWVLSNVIRSDL